MSTEDSIGTENSIGTELALIEQRLRADLPDLAEALLAAEVADRTPVAAERRRPRGGVLLLAAAAVVTLFIGGAALWFVNDDSGQIEAALDDDEGGADDRPVDEAAIATADDPGWYELPDVDARPFAHMASVWNGKDAIFWGGRTETDGGTLAGVGGAAYNPGSDAWLDIAAPEWGHPGAEGVFHGRWLYVLSKGRVSKFDPGTGEETEFDLPNGAARGLFVLRDQVWVILRVAGGLSAVPIESQGRIVDATPLSAEPWPFELDQPGDRTLDNLATHDGDLYVSALGGSVFRIDGETGEFAEVVSPAQAINPNDLRVYSGESYLAVVSIDGDNMWVGGPESDGMAWFELPIPGIDPVTSTIVAAGDWLTALPSGRPPVSIHLQTYEQIVHDDSPLAGYANPNAVWTGQELVVWGGQGEPAGSGSAVGARWVPPFVPGEDEATEVVEEAIPAEGEAVDSQDESGPTVDLGDFPSAAELAAAIEALPFEQRVDVDALDMGELSTAFTSDGVWVYTRPQPEILAAHGEIVRLEKFAPPIVASWAMPYRPTGVLATGFDSVYCLAHGGGPPGFVVCTIDPETGDQSFWVGTSEIADPFSLSTGERGVIVGGRQGHWMLLDPDDLSPIDVVDTGTGEPVVACPLLGTEFALTEQPDLPDAVAATRQALFDAAMSCDFDRLIELGADTSTSFGGGSFAQNLDLAPSGGGADLTYLVQLLNLPFAVEEFAAEADESAFQDLYTWPSAFTDDSGDGSGISDDELAALTDIFGPTFLTDLQDFGGYYQWRVGIDADGTWSFFIAGD